MSFEQTQMVAHGFSSRPGGLSAPPYESLNLGFHVNDSDTHVLTNRERFTQSFGMELDSVVCAEQVHGNKVAVVTKSDAGSGSAAFSGSIPGTDALITNSPGIPLMLFFADCVPLFILDPVNKAIGLAHAGWKGTALKIGAETLRVMTDTFGTDPNQCIAAIGPSIEGCCYNVSQEVAQRILEASGDERVVVNTNQDLSRINLKLANRSILVNAGIPETNIAVSDLCTACNPEHFFSYRRDGVTGRMAAVMMLR